MKEVAFNAPWGAPLALMTGVCAVICLLIPIPGLFIALGVDSALHFVGMTSFPPMLQWSGWLMVGAPLLTLLISAVFMVRGYVLTDDSLLIKRLGWKTTVKLSKLMTATTEPDAFDGSIRLFGNGGLFSFTGLFRNKKFGAYRAYATDAKRAVVLRFSDKILIITPDDPQKFVAEIAPNLWTPSEQ